MHAATAHWHPRHPHVGTPTPSLPAHPHAPPTRVLPPTHPLYLHGPHGELPEAGAGHLLDDEVPERQVPPVGHGSRGGNVCSVWVGVGGWVDGHELVNRPRPRGLPGSAKPEVPPLEATPRVPFAWGTTTVTTTPWTQCGWVWARGGVGGWGGGDASHECVHAFPS